MKYASRSWLLAGGVTLVGAQVGATSHVLKSQRSTPALVANRPTLENTAFRDSDRQATTHKMPQVGDEGLEPPTSTV